MHYLIIGGCAAGLNAIEGIRHLDTDADITLISAEKYPPYARCLIINYIIGTHSENDLILREISFYEKNRVNLILGRSVKEILFDEKKVLTSDGKKFSYDKILIATGSFPKRVECKGIDKKGIFVLRTIDDAKKIVERSKKSEKAVVFGGGLIGIKSAYALKKRGLEVEIIVKSSQILSRVVNKKAADILSKWLKENGIKIITGVAPVEIIGNGDMKGAIFDNGEKIEAEIGIIAKGVSPNISFIKGKRLNINWGIVVDDYLKTNIPNVYSAGDVAETKDLITGEYGINALWMAAQEQGRTAGINMAGGEKKYPGSIRANAAEFFGLPFISFGEIGEMQNVEIKEVYDEKNYIYKRFVLKNDLLIGAVFIGDVKTAGFYMALVRNKVNLKDYKDLIGKDWFNYAKVKEFIESKEGFRESISPEGKRIFFR